MREQDDLNLQRLERALRRAEKRFAWMNRSVLDPAALKAAEYLCQKAGEDLAAYKPQRR
jgi:hypothetical protein